MKIQIIESTLKRPLANTKIQLQVKGKDSGFMTLSTDGEGILTLDDKYEGQQITATNSQLSGDSIEPQWSIATDGASLLVSTTGVSQKITENDGST